ncbi:MAG TPA: hypothetical protein VGO47_03130, partial [Chlamydiales bacterium]|nr:hypothetical protein [Chlamydiales bacterium]
MEHNVRHVPYYDVQLPSAVRSIIKENLWAVPSALAAKIHEDFPHVTSQQVYRTWASFSETMWKRSDNQIESAKILLGEMEDEADIFPITCEPGVNALAWGVKTIAEKLSGRIVEVAIDATCKFFLFLINLIKQVSIFLDNTNAKDLELYAVMAENDNTGMPLAYCLLTTATSITPGKRKSALESFFKALRDQYNITPRFVHTDKDIA